MAAVLAHGPRSVLGIHAAAAALLDLRSSARSSIDVIVPGARRRSTAAITVHRHHLDPDEVIAVDGIPVTTVARTLLDHEHHHRREAFERDHAKQAQLKAAGFEVLAFTHRQVADQPELVVEVVRAMLVRCRATEAG